MRKNALCVSTWILNTEMVLGVILWSVGNQCKYLRVLEGACLLLSFNNIVEEPQMFVHIR